MSPKSLVLGLKSGPPLFLPGGVGARIRLRTENLGLRTIQDDGSYERISRGFREQVAEGQGPVLAIAGLLAALIVGLALRSLPVWDRGGTRRLFRRLADASGLTRPERRLFLAVAERAGEEDPPALFFRRELFDEATADMAADPDLIESLRRKVYDP